MKALLVFVGLIVFQNSYCQSKLRPYAGLHSSMDAAGYYVGPSFQIGADRTLKNKILVTAYLHYFADRSYVKNADGDFFKGKYRSSILALLVQQNLSRKENGRWFLGGGVGLQLSTDDYESTFEKQFLKRTIGVIALRTGYRLPIKSQGLAFELNATGPYVSKKGPPPYFEQYTEIITQLSLGVRWIW